MPRDSDEFDFFVSYARADNAEGWVSSFVEELLVEHRKFSGGRELTCFFDKNDIGSFDDWQFSLKEGIVKSRLFLAFLSPNYFNSEWCRKEWKAWIDTAIAKHILSEGSAPIYFVEVPGFLGKVPGLDEQAMLGEHYVARKVAELCRPSDPRTDDFINATAPVVHQIRSRRQIVTEFVLPFVNQGIDALYREDLRGVLSKLAHELDERSERVQRAAKSVTTVPPYNKRFSGRLDELLDLRERLKDDQSGVICGVHGLGGVGKTELAFTYAHAFASIYPGGRYLVPCEGKTKLRDAALILGDLFRNQISEEDRKQPDIHFAAIVACLRERLHSLGHILMVLDNVTDLAVVSPGQTDLLTSLGPKLHLLATTRKLPPAGDTWLTLGELPAADALDLLEKHRPFADDAERAAAVRIVKRLGGFALAIELAAVWLAGHEETTYRRLVEGLGLEDLEQMAESDDLELRRHNHERRLTAVLAPVLDGLTGPERRAMEYAALLAPDLVPLPWLRSLVTHDYPELEQSSKLSDPWLDLCRRLERLALFTRVEEETTSHRMVRVHRLVQDLVREELSEEGLTACQVAVFELAQRRAAALEETRHWQDARWELKPLEALANIWADGEHPGAAWLLRQVGEHSYHLAEWTLAELLMRRALAIDKQSYGADHSEVAVDLSNLAELLRATNRLAEAEPLFRCALAIDETFYGKEHPTVARNLNNLAQLLKDTNRLEEAEQLMQRALGIFEKCHGLIHPKVALALNNLAKLLQVTKGPSEAEPLMRRALLINEEIYGPDHQAVAMNLHNLAQLLTLAEAEPMVRQAWAIYENFFGPDHPRIAYCLRTLANLLKDNNRIMEAEPMMRQALAIVEDTHEPDHPEVARCLNDLAQLLQATDRHSEAEPLMWRALAIDEKSLEPDHPEVAVKLNNLASFLSETKRLPEAEPLMRRMVEIFLKFTVTTGHSHPHLQGALGNYVGLLQAMGRSEADARQEVNDLLAEYGMSLG